METMIPKTTKKVKYKSGCKKGLISIEYSCHVGKGAFKQDESLKCFVEIEKKLRIFGSAIGKIWMVSWCGLVKFKTRILRPGRQLRCFGMQSNLDS
jgi:hypothetical protein